MSPHLQHHHVSLPTSLILPALAKAYYSITVYADVLEDRSFFQWTYPWLIDNLSEDVVVSYHLLGSGRYSVPQMCVLEQLRGNVFLQVDYLRCESGGLPSETCLCRSGIDAHIYKQCVLQEDYRATSAAVAYHQLNLTKSPIIHTFYTGPLYDSSHEEYLKAVCTMYFEEDKPPGCVTLKGNNNNTMSSFDRNNAVHFEC